jgi:four helix bundle protein
MTPPELRRRTAAFARVIVALVKPMVRVEETAYIARQLRRAALSTASNYRSAGRAKSHPDFTSKICSVLEEIDEAQGWLETLRDCRLVEARLIDKPLQEATELVKIFTKAYDTAKRNDESNDRKDSRKRRKRDRNGEKDDDE